MGPNSWCPVEVINRTGVTICSVNLKHRYDYDHFDEKTWDSLSDGAVGDGLAAGFWTGFLRTGKDYWLISFQVGGATFTCKDNFYCFLTKDDRGGLVRIELKLRSMEVFPPKSSGCTVTVVQKGGFPTANPTLGYYNIAHMVNTPEAVDWGIRKGANGLEADLNFDASGKPTVWRHGHPSDCTCSVLTPQSHVCSVVSGGSSCDAKAYLNHVAKKKLVALLIVDSKLEIGVVNQKAAGENVIYLLERDLFSRGFLGNVIVRTGKTKFLEYIQAASATATQSQYASRISFTFDGENNDSSKVFDALDKAGTKRRAYGTGITACLGKTYHDAIFRGCIAEHQGKQGITYIWTLEREDSMLGYLKSGARGIITNVPSVAAELFQRNGLKLATPQNTIP